jgi:hypothetical protein
MEATLLQPALKVPAKVVVTEVVPTDSQDVKKDEETKSSIESHQKQEDSVVEIVVNSSAKKATKTATKTKKKVATQE